MKRLWVRLSAAVAVVAALGGGGYYLVANGTDGGEGNPTQVADTGAPTADDTVVPVTDQGDPPAVAFDAPESTLGVGDAAQPPREPAQATWRDQPSQPIIRQVSGNDQETAYSHDRPYGTVSDGVDGQPSGDHGYAAGGPPPVDASSGDYGATATYGAQNSYTDTRAAAPPGADDGTASYGDARGYGQANAYGDASGYGGADVPGEVGAAGEAAGAPGESVAGVAAGAAIGAATGAAVGALAAGDASSDPSAPALGPDLSYGSPAERGGSEAEPDGGYLATREDPVAAPSPGAGGYAAAVGDSPAQPPAGFAADAVAPPPNVPRQDLSQPVAAPDFANGDPVAASNPAPGDPAVSPAAASPPSNLPQYDATPSPQFDSPSPGGVATAATAPPQPAAVPAPAYAPAPSAQPAAYRSAAPVADTAGLVTATPGPRELDGPQLPSISVEKLAPDDMQVGKPAAFKTVIRNAGRATAKNVVVTDRVPQGTQLIDVTPQPDQGADGSLVWKFAALEPNEEVVISLEVMPQIEGEIGNQALVTFQAQASARTICTKPELLVEHTTDPQVLIGDDVVFNITISNPGSGDATGIVLEEDVPPGLTHVAGSELEYEIGTLRPGESRRLELVLKASEAGTISNKLRVRGDGSLLAEHMTQLEVIAPKLQVGMVGPQRRYLDRQGTYQVSFSNTGTAIAKNVELATYMPKGLKFVSTGGKGQYDARAHAVYWSLDQLAPGQQGTVDLVAMPIATGEQKLQTEGTADLGLAAKYEHTTQVDAITAVVFTVKDTQDPIEVGSETTYEIFVANHGTKTGTNVQLVAILPEELTPISGEGTSRVAIQGQQMVMEPIERMGPGDEASYKIKVKGRLAGDHVIDVRLVCDELPVPVTKQESTKVYSDGL